MNTINQFKELHQQDNILHIGNAWDANSALEFEKMGYKAVGTSSAAIADTLGYEDGEQMSFDELLNVVKSILNKISTPLTVDIEGGFSRKLENIVRNINQLCELGVVGINFEDSFVNSKGERHIIDSSEFSHTIKSIKNRLTKGKNDIFLNIRTDSFLMNLDNSLEETIVRVKKYQKSGADGLFIPCVISGTDIEKLVKHATIPINIMAMPNLPSFLKLQEIGVKRLSSGAFIYQNSKNDFASLNKKLTILEKEQSFDSLFE